MGIIFKKMTARDITKFIQPLVQRVLLTLGRGIIKAIDDSGGIQKLQISLLKGETTNGLERIQEYGFTSFPKVDAEAFAAFIGGNRDHGFVIAVDDRRYRFKPLAEGEVCIYTDENTGTFGHRIHMKRNREIEVYCKTLDAHVEEHATLTVGGNENENVTGNSNETIGGNKIIAASGNVSISGANINISANGTTTVNLSGNATVNSSGTLDILGGSVNLGAAGGQNICRNGDSTSVAGGGTHSHTIISSQTNVKVA